MKKIIIVTHGTLCEGFLSSMKIITGSNENIDTVSLDIVETIEVMSEKVLDVIKTYDEQDTVIILTDLAIGTTTKCIFPLFEERELYVISGVNLPMLLEIYLTDLSEEPYEKLKTIVENCKATMLFINEEINKME